MIRIIKSYSNLLEIESQSKLYVQLKMSQSDVDHVVPLYYIGYIENQYIGTNIRELNMNIDIKKLIFRKHI